MGLSGANGHLSNCGLIVDRFGHIAAGMQPPAVRLADEHRRCRSANEVKASARVTGGLRLHLTLPGNFAEQHVVPVNAVIVSTVVVQRNSTLR